MANRNRRLRILIPYVSLPSFIRADVDALGSRYSVRLADCNSVLKSLVASRSVFWADCVFCWFGSLRFIPLALIARLLKKKVVIIAGGYDVASVAEIEYGNMRRPVTRQLGRFLFRMADRVACFSRSSLEDARVNAKISPEKLRLIYLGYEPNFTIVNNVQKQNFVLTVGNCDISSIYRKGTLTVARLSQCLPEVQFVLAGSTEANALRILKDAAGSNVTFTGYVNKEDLHNLFSKAKVYLQPSIHEGFGAAVAEAMLYDCIPIVSNRCSLPEVVGESGIYVDPYDLETMASTIKRILETEVSFPEPGSKRILRKFPASQRKALLFGMVEEICSSFNGKPPTIKSERKGA